MPLDNTRSTLGDGDGISWFNDDDSMDWLICCANQLVTNLGEDDKDDFMEDINIDSFEPFQYKSEAEVGKLEKISFGPFTRLNERLKVVCARFEDVFSMTLPREPARLPPFPVTINREKWDVA